MWSKQSCLSVTALFALVTAGCAGGTVAEAPPGNDAGAGGSCEDCQEDGGSSSSSGGESGDAGRVCNPGDEHDCDCADGSTGTQVCNDDGDGYGDCDCPEPSTGGTGGTANECVNGQQQSCTCNNGNDGIQVCNNGCWGACDCPDYLCTPGDEDPCPCGNGVIGIQVCDDDGQGYGDCDCPGPSYQCTPGDVEDCFCGSGITGTHVCASDGQSWGACDCPEPSTGGTGGSGGSGGGGNARTYTIRWTPDPLAVPYLTNTFFSGTINDGDYQTFCGTQGNSLADVIEDGDSRICEFSAIPGDRLCHNVRGAYSDDVPFIEGVNNQQSFACWEDWGCPTCCQGCGQTDPVGRYRPFGEIWFEEAHFAQSSDWVGAHTLVPMTETRDGSEYEFTILRLTEHAPNLDIQWNYQVVAGGCNICLTLP